MTCFRPDWTARSRDKMGRGDEVLTSVYEGDALRVVLKGTGGDITPADKSDLPLAAWRTEKEFGELAVEVADTIGGMVVDCK